MSSLYQDGTSLIMLYAAGMDSYLPKITKHLQYITENYPKVKISYENGAPRFADAPTLSLSVDATDPPSVYELHSVAMYMFDNREIIQAKEGGVHSPYDLPRNYFSVMCHLCPSITRPEPDDPRYRFSPARS